MTYGLENNILNAPLSLIVSIILFLGVFLLGNLVLKFIFAKFDKLNYKNEYIFFSPIVWTYVLIFLIYILINIDLGKHSFKFFGYLIFFLGLINIYFIYKSVNIYFKKTNFNLFLSSRSC